MKKQEYFEIYDEVTNKTLHIDAFSLKEAEILSQFIDFNNYNDGDFIQLPKPKMDDVTTHAKPWTKKDFEQYHKSLKK